MKTHEYTHGSEAEDAGRYFVRIDWFHTVQTDYWIADVPNEHQTRHLFFSVNTLSQFLVEPRRVHLVAAKHVMRYLKGTIDCGLGYDEDHDFRLSGQTDSD